MIRRRHVFHIGGYDPIDPESQFERLDRSLSSFGRTWKVASQISSVTHPSNSSSSCKVEAWGPNWKTETCFEMLRWDDLIERESRTAMLPRLGYALRALFDFVVTGTLFRYIVASWKYAAFFAFPYVCIALFGLAGVGLAGFAARLAELTGVPAAASAIVISVAAFLALMKWFGPHRINHILDDTIFSWQFLHGRRPELEKRLDEFAARILERAEKADVDEIVIVGHSLGAAMAIATVARCLIKDSQFGKRGLALHVLTVGATIPKFSLHPKGDQIRKAARIVADELSISWVEYQARDDVISFYRFDPVTLKRVSRDDLYGRPNIRRVQIHSMMNPASYKRHRFDFMRIHYQFLMGNDQRAPYDYCMVICGPLDFRCVTALTGAVGRISADGSMINEATADQ